MKVAMLFDGVSALGPTPDLLILETVEAVERELAAAGHDVVRVPVNPDGRWIERMRRAKFDLAFNLCEGIDGVAKLEPAVIGALELLGVPYTGSSAWTTAICLRKHGVNALLEGAGLPVPRWALVRRGERVPRDLPFPAICKPAAEDASLGVSQQSVVRSQRALSDRVREMHEMWDEILVQQYIDGREVNVGLVGDLVLPVAEIDFRGMPDGLWRIVSYRSKWETGSDEDLGAAPRCPADFPPAVLREIAAIARAAWAQVGGSGYGRVDMRVDAAGRPWILEVNANPDFAADAGLARMAKVAGMDFRSLVDRVCALAIEQPVTDEEQWALMQRLSGIGVARPLARRVASRQ